MLSATRLASAKNGLASLLCSYRQKSTVGFVGLGNMGSHMAKNLIKKGHAVAVYDVSPEAMSGLVDHGAIMCQSPADVAKTSDRIVTMLPNSQHVLQVYSAEDGLLQKLNEGTLLIDSSTIDPMVAKEVSDSVQKKCGVFMDAPVSGGVNAARDGTLTFMVGGAAGEFAAAQQLLSCMGKNVVHCGAVSSGQAAKICNNMLLAVSMIGTAEAMNLGIRLGLDPKLLAAVMSQSTGRCWSVDTYNPVPNVMDTVPSSNEYKGGFGTGLMCKDLGLAQNAATAVGAATPLGAAALQIYRMMAADGMAAMDFSSVYKHIGGKV